MRKHKAVMLRFRKKDPGHNVLAAVSRWVKANGGTILVIGGIGIMPGEGAFQYYVTVQCMGQPPIRKEADKARRQDVEDENVVNAKTAS